MSAKREFVNAEASNRRRLRRSQLRYYKTKPPARLIALADD